MDLIPTPSQTIGPFFHICLSPHAELENVPGEKIRLVVRILDGDAAPIDDALLEFWHADSAGEYGYFARLCTNRVGAATFDTVKPGRVDDQAPHINLTIFARGLLKQLCTRIYFENDPSNQADAVLALVPEARRGTLMARRDCYRTATVREPVWNFEIRLCSESETVFFDI